METPTLKCPRSGRLLTPLSMDYWHLKKKMDKIFSDSSTTDGEEEEETPLKRPLNLRKEIVVPTDETPSARPRKFTPISSRKPVLETPKENEDPLITDIKSRRSPSQARNVLTSATKPADSEESDEESSPILPPIRRRRRAQKFIESSSSESEGQENRASSGSAEDETENLSRALFSVRIGSTSPPPSVSDARTKVAIEISSDDDHQLSSGVKDKVKPPPLQQSNVQNRPKPPVTEPKNRTRKDINRKLIPPPSAPPKGTRKARVNFEVDVDDDDDSDFDGLLEKLRNRKHENDVYDESQVDLNNSVCEWEKSNENVRRFLESLDEDDVSLGSCHKDAFRYRTSKFDAVKDELAAKLFDLFHESVFQNRFDTKIPITWNVHMKTTAGFCISGKNPDGSKYAKIQLSPKVVDRTSRLRDTLLHELCHAASWLIHGYRNGHGTIFKFWGQRSYQLLGLKVTTRHTYVIETKYIYKCQGCANEIRRHSKSLDTSRIICGNCRGRFKLYVNDKRSNKQTPASERKQSAFSKFVKEEYKVIKAKSPHLKHGEVMSALSERWKTMKINV